MTAAALPFSCGYPALVKKEPLECPWDDGVGNELIGKPFALVWIVQTKPGKLRRVAKLVHMLRGLTSTAWIRANGRIENRNILVGVNKSPVSKLTSSNITDANTVSLTDRGERPFPNADPIGVHYELEFWPFGLQSPFLLPNGKRPHCRHPP